MKTQKTRKQTRIWILTNYFSLIAALILFYSVKNYDLQSSYLFIEIGIFAIFTLSLFKGLIHTKFWKMVHTSSKNLDEREMLVVLKALRYAYSIFAIICLLIIYAFAIAESQAIDVVLAAGLLYLAHSLPVAIVAWGEDNYSEE